ncbi:MAG: mechanosensitive ion channel domain-containing protein [Bryobacteraceae bacterium]
MKLARPNLTVTALAVLLAACAAGWFVTRNAYSGAPARQTSPVARVSKVDEKPLETARQLATLADTHAERELAEQAARLAGQEVDEDFAAAIREAATITAPASGPLHDLAAKIDALKARTSARQQKIAQLTKDAASSSAAAVRLELANAQLSLEQDELDDAQQDLAREGGDEHANLQRAQEQHQAIRQAPLPLGKLSSAGSPGALKEQIQEWSSLSAKLDQIETAKQDTDRKAASLAQAHNALEGKVAAAPAASDDEDDGDDPATAVAQLRHLSDQRKTMIDLDKRTQLCQQLSGVYQKWLPLVADRRRGVLHALAGSMGAILAILLAAAMVKGILARFLSRQADRRRVHQLSVVTRIGIHTVAVILILLVIFGAPTQTPTIIGLAGAGMTVVMKDFIVAFFGWFVLMGRHGIGLGDWVEINGVGGEVIEVGVMKTTLLEMGNWTSTGHPTGRRVSFMNGFAIEGHYFNFSTAGQWLWDELQVILPADGDPYRLAEQLVERETEEDAKLAEQDWTRVTNQYGTRAFSARPAADLRPSQSGLIVNVRYITRGPLRYEVKSRLFTGIVELMHGAGKVATT